MRTISEIEEAICVAKRKVDKAHTSSELTAAINELSHLNFELSQAEKFKASGKENAEHMALQEIRKWANGSHAHLSQAPGYARGYKDGIGQAKEITALYSINISKRTNRVKPKRGQSSGKRAG